MALLAVVLMALVPAPVVSDNPSPPEPTEGQLAAAKELFAKVEAHYHSTSPAWSTRKWHVFLFSREISDADLEAIPRPEFGHALAFPHGAGVTDRGLKSLAESKGLVGLFLGDSKATPAGLKALRNLRSLQSLGLGGAGVTDEFAAEVAAMKQLRDVVFIKSSVTAMGLRRLGGLERLSGLCLAESKVGDAEMKEIARLRGLRELDLRDTKVTDTGLKDLHGIKSLRRLILEDTAVTSEGVKALKAALPECKVAFRAEKAVKPDPGEKKDTRPGE